MESTTEYILLGKWWSFLMSRATPSSSKVLWLCLAVVVVVVVDGRMLLLVMDLLWLWWQ